VQTHYRRVLDETNLRRNCRGDTDPSMEGVVEGDIVVIELIDPNLIDPNA
jgi:hypothetical protein